MRLPLMLIVALSISIVATRALAYPIYYKCDANRQMTEVITGEELDQQLTAFLGLPTAKRQEAAKKLCIGLKDCQEDLLRLSEIAQIDVKILDQAVSKELESIRSTTRAEAFQEIGEEGFAIQKLIRSTSQEIQACRAGMTRLEPEAFERNGIVSLFYPHRNEYTYGTGCRVRSEAYECTPTLADEMRSSIRSALAAGADPYAFLAIGMMENGENGWTSLRLDPIGSMAAMGCREIPSNPSDPGNGKKLESFGNYHQISAGVIDQPALARRLVAAANSPERAASPDTKPLKPGTSYYCKDVSNNGLRHASSPVPNSCCLKLPVGAPAQTEGTPNKYAFSPDSNSAAFEKGLTAEYVRQVIQSPMAGKPDPAFRLQRFNGFSRLMGGAEGVPAFRAGVDYFSTPAYGYQAMDFVLKTLISNPWIRAEIEKAKKEIGVKTPSLLCLDVKSPGAYRIDSDHYYQKHRDSGRLNVLKGRNYASFTGREKKVFLQELATGEVAEAIEKKFGALPMDVSKAKKKSAILEPWHYEVRFGNRKYSAVTTFDQKTGQPLKTIYLREPGDEGLLPEASTDTRSDGAPSIGLEQIVDPALYETGFTMQAPAYEQRIEAFGDFKFTQVLMPGDSVVGHPSGIPLQETVWKYPNGIQMIESQSQGFFYLDSSGKKLAPGDPRLKNLFSAHEIIYRFANDSGYRVKMKEKAIPAPNQFNPANNTTTYLFSDGKKLELWSGTQSQARERRIDPASRPSIEEVTRYYFREIYPEKRSTVGRASSFDWRKLTTDEAKKLGEAMRQGHPTDCPQCGSVTPGGGIVGGIGGGFGVAPTNQPPSKPFD